jgi:hypothetical protein
MGSGIQVDAPQGLGSGVAHCTWLHDATDVGPESGQVGGRRPGGFAETGQFHNGAVADFRFGVAE